MSSIVFNSQIYALNPNETLLECLLRHEINYPNSCQSGICQSCLMKAEEGIVHPSWQEGLPETLKIQGYFLACLAKPDTALKVATPNSTECEMNAKILSMSFLNHNVMQIKLSVGALDNWTPGQYINFINPLNTIRSYSIANIPSKEGFIELHVKIYPEGSMGKWLTSEAKKDTEVMLRGPFGRCFYHNPDHLAFDMLLAGTGTGLAPLIAIIKTALTQNHKGRITLVHGGLTDDDIYYREELEMLSVAFPSFVYDACVLRSEAAYPEVSIEKRALTHLNHPKETRLYVCGPQETTNKLKKQFFLAGVPSKAILSDAFL